ncbi:DNA-binding protein [soil metagenome]
MNVHTFTLILSGPVDERIDDLFEAGCDDATFGEIDGVAYADFDREADSFIEAVVSAIRAISSVPGLRVRRLEPDDLVTAADIAQRLGRTRESVRLLVSGERGDGGFPAPVSHTQRRNRIWRWSDVVAWANPDDAHAIAMARLVAAINAKLDLKALEPGLPEPERKALAAVAA